MPLAPLLYREHLLALVLIRPTKEVLLAAGFEVRRGDLLAPSVVVATIPLAVLGVWLFYALGRAFAAELTGGALPGLAGRMLPQARIVQLGRVLEREGAKVVFLGRLAVFPSSLLAAAAGVAGMRPRTFLLADGAGALTSIIGVLALGYAFGEAYEEAGPWITGVGVVVAVIMLVALGRWLKREADDGAGAERSGGTVADAQAGGGA